MYVSALEVVICLCLLLGPVHSIGRPFSIASACPPRPASDAEQRYIFDEFVQAFYIDSNVTAAYENYVWEYYIQHDPAVGQGRDAAIAALIPAVAATKLLEVVHQGFDNGTGYVHHYNFGTSGSQTKFIDVYRMNGSCIVEHWDVIANLTTAEINPTPLSP